MDSYKEENGKLYKLVICKCIKRNGKIIYPKNGKCFAFYVPVKEAA
jgi:hypothetical protein